MNVSTFSAVVEPHRFQIVELLLKQPLTVGEIATRLDIRQPQASKHLRVLSEAGVVEMEAVANRRICRLRPEPFRDLDNWLATDRQLWEDRFDQLDSYLQQLQQSEQDAGRPRARPSAGSRKGVVAGLPQEAFYKALNQVHPHRQPSDQAVLIPYRRYFYDQRRSVPHEFQSRSRQRTCPRACLQGPSPAGFRCLFV